jgi:hypothetical protein
LRSSVCINVRPARLVERTAAPSEPMPFELWESEREGAEGSKERTGRGKGGLPCNNKPDVIILTIIIRRKRGRERAGGKKEAAFPPPPPLRTNTAVGPHTGQAG